MLPILLTSAALAASAPPEEVADQLITRMAMVNAGIKDSTYILHKQEWIDGGMSVEEDMAIWWRRPHDVFIRWVGPVNTNRELMYKPGWNDDRLRVNPGRFLPTVDLDPAGSIAMRGQRHTIKAVGMPYVVGIITRDHALLTTPDGPRATVVDEGIQAIYGEPARCYRSTMPKQDIPSLYGNAARVCVNERTGLPALLEVWDDEDGANRLIERFGFEGVQLNTGLDDAVFDVDNPAYGF